MVSEESNTGKGDCQVKYFEEMAKFGHEQLSFNYSKTTGLKSIIAIHDTTLGPALGGCRMWPYATEEEAVNDALRLSRGMTYKTAASGDNWGGGKSVIWGDPATDKNEAFLRAFGRQVQAFNGRFITGTDVGTVATDFVFSSLETEYLVALPEEYGGSGDSSILTAFGVLRGIQACAKQVWGSDSLQGKTVAVQGVGKVGHHLVDYLVEQGANLIIADINPNYIKRVTDKHPQVKVVPTTEIMSVACDIFSPNALGAVMNDETIPALKCKIVAGAANNVLKEARHGDALHQRGILYAPDYVINGGGLIQVADELMGYDPERAKRKVANIYNALLRIFAISERDGIGTHKAADRLVEERLAKIGAVSRIYSSQD
jgi:leucine dehydrogenase